MSPPISFLVRGSEPDRQHAFSIVTPLRSRLRHSPANNTGGAVASEAGVLSKQDELLAMEEHLGVLLGQQAVEA